MVKLGIDRISEYRELFADKRIALITNFSGISSRMIEDLDEFNDAGFSVVKLFTPEHGLYGEFDGKAVDSCSHPKYGIPVLSLYGDSKEPKADDLADIDLLVYDIQDVGLRYYTYIYTLAYCMKAADKAGLPFIVLDRPNPLGRKISGPVILPENESFVGAHGLPVRYGLTIGELGSYYKEYFGLSLDYTVIPLEGFCGDMLWPATSQLWNLPSPSMHTFDTNLCYNGGCFFEATNISEGRGTGKPFQIYGAPFVVLDRFIDELRRRLAESDLVCAEFSSAHKTAYRAFSDTCALRPRAFTPFWSKHAHETCFGVEFIPTSAELDFLVPAIVTLKTFRDLYPDDFEYVKYADVSRLDSLSGDGSVTDYLEGRLTLRDLIGHFDESASSFALKAKQFKIYG